MAQARVERANPTSTHRDHATIVGVDRPLPNRIVLLRAQVSNININTLAGTNCGVHRSPEAAASNLASGTGCLVWTEPFNTPSQTKNQITTPSHKERDQKEGSIPQLRPPARVERAASWMIVDDIVVFSTPEPGCTEKRKKKDTKKASSKMAQAKFNWLLAGMVGADLPLTSRLNSLSETFGGIPNGKSSQEKEGQVEFPNPNITQPRVEREILGSQIPDTTLENYHFIV
ncbi:hypothetical protein B0H19DRAFT_1074153 [Mycena capillaripes]|nr:hypothetical protein B0H19DRAFT_1074153 [Mycena capillaripes]